MTIHPTVLTGEEKILYNHILDLCSISEKRYVRQFSSFLNPREQKIALTASRFEGSLFGGFEHSQRKVFGISMHDTLSHHDFPVAAVKFLHQKGETLSHRQVLGTIMSLGVTRGSIGDILPYDGECIVICTVQILPVLLHEIRKIGGNGVSAKEIELSEFDIAHSFIEVKGNVSSLRLDSITALLTNSSRNKATEIINSGFVQVNYSVEKKPSVDLGLEDTITIRGYGKYILNIIGKPTRKNRLPLVFLKYN